MHRMPSYIDVSVLILNQLEDRVKKTQQKYLNWFFILICSSFYLIRDEQTMLFKQEFFMLWSALELFMALTHLFVFLGIKNSSIHFLRRKHNYFLLDGMCHFVHLFIYRIEDVGVPLYLLWIYAFIAHMYYYRNLKVNPPPLASKTKLINGNAPEDGLDKICRIFHWSCIDYKANRFSLTESGKEMLETSCDVIAHTAGFYLALCMLNSIWYQIGVFVITAIVFHKNMLSLKQFLTEPKMMPVSIQRLMIMRSVNM